MTPHEHSEKEETERARNASDLLLLIVALAALVVLFGVAHVLPAGSAQFTKDVARVAESVPRLASAAVAAVAALATVGLLVALAVPVVRGDRRDGLNAIVAAALTVLAMAGAVTLWHRVPGPVARAMLASTDGSGLVRDAALVAFLTASGSVRCSRLGRWAVLSVTLLVLAGVGLHELTGLGAVVAPASGYAIGLAARWALGTTVMLPSIAIIAEALSDSGLDLRHLDRQDGSSARLRGSDEDGVPVSVIALGREARGSRVLRRLWSILRLRGAATGYQPLGVWSQLQTRALANLLASRSQVRAPLTLMLGHVEPDTILLAERPVEGPALTSSSSEEDVKRLFGALRDLHRAGVAHRDLRPDNLVCDGPDTGFRSLEHATVAAGELVRRIDVAQLLASVGTKLGAKAAVGALRKGYDPVDELRIAALLQPVALMTWGWREARAARKCLSDLRRELLGVEPEAAGAIAHPERLERFRWRTVATVIAMTLAAYLLVGQLSKVSLLGTLSHVNLAWFAIAVVGSAATYVGSSLNLVAFVPKKVSVLRGSAVELSGAFIGLVTPPSVGHVAVNARYLQRQGVDPVTTGGAVAVSQLVNVIVTVTLLVVTALITGAGGGHLNVVPGPRLLYVIGAALALAGIAMAVPRSRHAVVKRVWPPVHAALPRLLEVLSQPSRLLMGVGGNLLLTASYVLALVASLEAVGAHPPVLATAAVYMAGNAVGTAAPTPGGIGAVEAVLAAGLTAVGISAHDAVPAVLIFRIATFWLPILPGWATFLVLQRRRVI